MSTSLTISVYHDKRHKKKSGSYPVKIQVYSKNIEGKKRQKFFKLSKPLHANEGHSDLTLEEFEKA